MNRIPVKSSQIVSIGHEAETGTLEIELTRHDPKAPPPIYRYAGVPVETYETLIGAASIGIYFGSCIKTQFPCTRLDSSDGVFKPLDAFKASGAQRDLIRKLAKRAALWDGTEGEYIGPMWRPVVAAAGKIYEDAARLSVESWLSTLSTGQAGGTIDYLKSRT